MEFWLIFIVMFTVSTSTASPCSTRMLCPLDWEPWGDFCYKLTTEGLTWADARLNCQAMGGEMAAPSSKEENDYLTSSPGKRLWINCNDDKNEGQWVCKNSGDYNNWNTDGNEPGGGPSENCAAIFKGNGGKWADYECSNQFLAACKGQQVKLRSWRLLASCLLGYTFRELPTSSVRACAVMCAYDPGCRSFNVRHFGHGGKQCHLNNATRFDADHAQFVTMDNLYIYGEK